MATLDEIGSYLAAAGVGVIGESLFLARSPDAPDDVVTVYLTPGMEPERIHNRRGLSVEHPRLQVVARSRSFKTAESVAVLAYDALALIRNQVIGETWYLQVTPTNTASLIGTDANNLILVGFNAQMSRRAP